MLFSRFLPRLLALVFVAGASVFAPAAHALVPSTTTVVGPGGPVVYGTAVTFTATVSGLSPTGTVTFSDTSGPVGAVTTTVLSVLPVGSARPLGVPSGGMATASITISTLAAGTHSISAAYSGDVNNTTSSTAPLPAAQLTLVVNQIATATTLTGSGSPTNFGQAVTLTATVTGGVNASGSVTYKIGGVQIGVSPVTVATGVATLSIVTLQAGSNVITAVYAGDTNNVTSTSGTLTQTVNPVPTTTAFAAVPNPVVFGQPVTMEATVTGALPLGGNVRFFDGTTVIGTQAVGASGNRVDFSTTTLTVGPHPLYATYVGDTNHSASVGITVPLTVTAAPTMTTLAVTPNPVKSGSPISLTATVTGTLATGKVTFTDGTTTLGSATLAGGTASLNLTSLASGPHSVVATYSGDTNYSGSASGTVSLTVSQPPVAIASSQNPSAAGQSVTFTVTVTGNGPTGTVTFLDGTTSLADVTMTGGVATYSTSTLQAGNHQIFGRYNGDANNTSGFSAALTQVVGPVAPQTGYWWNPAEAGRGYVIEQRGNNLFMATFLYDVSGRASWYGIGPGAITNSSYTGTLDSYAGGQTLTGAYQPAAISGSGGAVTVSFTSPTQGSLTWPEGTIPIQRYDFGPGGSATTQPAGTPQTGWWWAPTEGGRGYSIEVQGNSLFLAGYMYDTQGNPIWYASGPTPLSDATTYQGVWQLYGNGQTLTGKYQSPTIVNTNVGSIIIQFATTSTGTLTFPDGRQVAIQRYAF